MKVILYNAISIDGFIAVKDGDTSWVSPSDWEEFAKFIVDAGIIVMGKNTYVASGEDFPYVDAINIVMTNDKALQEKSTDSEVFTDKTPHEVVAFAKAKGFEKLLLIGGGLLNGSFLNDGLIDEIVISIHPIVLNKGIRLFENTDKMIELEYIESKVVENLVQARYKVLK